MGEVLKIGWVVSAMTPGQLQYDIIRASNEYLAGADDVDISLYWVQDGPRVLEPRFSAMNIFELYGFNGHCVCTSLHTLSRAIAFPGPNRQKKIWFFDYNLDYMKVPRQWEQLNALYNHPKVEIIARSQEHSDIISSVFRQPIGIVGDCNITKIKELLSGQDSRSPDV